MKFLQVSFLILTALASLGMSQRHPSSVESGVINPSWQPVVKTESRPDVIRRLRAATCRVERPTGGHGSGVAFRKDAEGYTWVLTAKHVVDGIPKEIHFTLSYAIGEKDIQEAAYLTYVSSQFDLAILKVKDSFLQVCDLEAPTYVAKAGTAVVAMGFPLDMYAAVVTYGQFLGENGPYYYHDAVIYFGNSGGPLFDFETGKLIGINVRLKIINKRPRGDHGLAERLENIYTFLKEIEAANAKVAK